MAFPFNEPLILPIKTSLFLEERTDNKYLSIAYYLISSPIIPEILVNIKVNYLVQ